MIKIIKESSLSWTDGNNLESIIKKKMIRNKYPKAYKMVERVNDLVPNFLKCKDVNSKHIV
jgi:hypothetical protein